MHKIDHGPIPMEITAAVVHERGGPFHIERVELAGPEAGEVLVRVAASGICQTDVHARDGYFPIRYPAVYGHEGAGIVERTGPGVEKVKPGDRVIMVFPSCGTCVYCTSGKPAYCLAASRLKQSRDPRRRVNRDDPQRGAGVSAASSSSHRLPPSRWRPNATWSRFRRTCRLNLLAAFPCGINTGAGAVLNVLRPQPGDAFAVFGTGTVGLAGLMAARIAGCEPIIAVDLHPNRLALARSLGATHTINAAHSDPVAEIRNVTGGLGVRASLEAAGSPQALRQAVDCLQPLGTCCLVGSSRKGTEAKVDMNHSAKRPYSPRLHSGRQHPRAIHSPPDRSVSRRKAAGRAARHVLRLRRYQPGCSR